MGKVTDAEQGNTLPDASLTLLPSHQPISINQDGEYKLGIKDSVSNNQILVQHLGYQTDTLPSQWNSFQTISLNPNQQLDEVVITGTLRPVSRKESPIPVEVYQSSYFKTNPSPSLLESTSMINGIRPQINCNVCNTGDIHINGMEGPYTLVLIDGMPIVSALSSVYGLSSIPNSMVQQLEVVKGPAAALYGSEAMGGIINVITKNPEQAPAFSAEIMGSTWKEFSTDLAWKTTIGKKLQSLWAVHGYYFDQPVDHNEDGFTDMAIQHRISLFSKTNWARQQNRLASLGMRYVYEDRWGGQTNWTKDWMGSDSLYGEYVQTKRWELIGQYQLPLSENVLFQYSANQHQQNSWYGTTPFRANQLVTFAQLYWDKQVTRHELLAGASFRYTFYDDNTVATVSPTGENATQHTPLPGLFFQDNWKLNSKHHLLLGYRLDYDRHHGFIQSPRIAYKWMPHSNHTFRGSLGSGFRVVNVFTEDHAALTGSRTVQISEALHPERSYNSNLNYTTQFVGNNSFLNLDIILFYNHFTNKIIANYDQDPNAIIYANLNGYSVSRGGSINLRWQSTFPLEIMAGMSYMDVFQKEHSQKTQQLFAPKWSGNFSIQYTPTHQLTVDLNAQWNGPMRLPIQPNDYRPEYAPWHCIANLQIRKKWLSGWEVFCGIKNLLNFVPQNIYLRAWDPFDKYIDQNNPEQFTFDTSYSYASQQGIRGYAGVRFQL